MPKLNLPIDIAIEAQEFIVQIDGIRRGLEIAKAVYLEALSKKVLPDQSSTPPEPATIIEPASTVPAR